MDYKNSIILNSIIKNLILYSSKLNDIGLYHGKMGISIFFFHLYRYTGNTIYEDFANMLIDEIYSDINLNIPINLEYGLSGIGWGINYLITKKFVDGNPDEILGDIDEIIMQYDISRIKDTSINTGVYGISCYINYRIDNNFRHKNKFFDEKFISEIHLISQKYTRIKREQLLYYIIKNSTYSNCFFNKNLGIYKGLAGYGLKLLLN